MKMPFTLSQLRPIREAMTVSRPAKLGESVPVTWFSLGGGTSITPEYYDCTTLYLCGEGCGDFLLGEEAASFPCIPPAAGRSAQNALRLSDRQRHDLY